MTTFSWLHLTDLHLGMAEQVPFMPAIRDRFFEDLKRLHENCGPWDFVLFTGDLTQRASSEDFEKVDEFLAKLWDLFGELGSGKPALFAVPGNHDLVRPNPKEPEVKVLRNDWVTDRELRSEFWTEPKSRYRNTVNNAFANYAEWWKKLTHKPPVQSGLLPGDFSAVIEKGSASLGIVGLNTAFLQLTGGDYKGKLAVDARQFQSVCNDNGPEWVKKHNACLLLTHHPPDWLNPESKKDLIAEIVGNDYFAAHFFGHMHEARYKSEKEGGASALRASQGTSLFGFEYFGEEKKLGRRHGYCAGRIELEGEKGSLVHWPREAFQPGGQWNFAADTKDFVLSDECTEAEEFPLLKSFEVQQLGAQPTIAKDEVRTRPFPNRWAVLVGINDYQHGFTPLHYCRQDAIAVAQALRELKFEKVFEIHEQAQVKPERDAIFSTLGDIRDSGEVHADDLFLFYFSGHGINEGGKDYLLPIGARPGVKQLGIKVHDLTDSLKAIGCKNTVMFIDACRDAIAGAKGTASIGDDSKMLFADAGLVSFFSCRPMDRSFEIEPLEHGSFTYCLLQAIEGGLTTISKVGTYLQKNVPQINSSYEKPTQQPYVWPEALAQDLEIFFNPTQSTDPVGELGKLINELVKLRSDRDIEEDDFLKCVGFIDQIRDKDQLDQIEETKLSAIKGLCSGWKLATFREVWESTESRRPVAVQIRKPPPPRRK